MARKVFYAFSNEASAEEATLQIFDEIGFWGTEAASFARRLAAITAPVINLEINSPGGSVFDGIAIYNLLRSSGKKINAKVMGVAASIASVILLSADKIVMPANTMVMVHAPSGGVYGTAEDMRDMAEVLDKVQTSLVATYMKRTGLSEEEVRAMLAKDTWLTADEAKEKGFADEVTDAVELTASFDITDDEIPEAARTAFKAAADKRAADEAKAKADKEAADKAEAEKLAAAAKPFAEQVTDMLKGTGFEAHAAAWAVKFTKPEEVTARIAECREITALFALANKADKCAAVITAGKSLAEARAELTNLIADGDEHIDTSKPTQNAAAAPEALKPSSVYAKRKENSSKPGSGPSAATTAGVWAKRNK